MSKHVLVVGLAFNKQFYRELIRSILANSYTLSIVGYSRSFCQFSFDDYTSDCLHLTQIEDPNDEALLLREIKKIHEANAIDGVISLDHFVIRLLAGVCEQLSIRYLSLRAASICEDKLGMQLCLKDAGLPFNEIYSIDQVMNRDDLVYPLIIKPRAGVASINVQTVRARSEIQAILRQFAANSGLARKALGENIDYVVEEYLEGILVSAECLVSESDFRLLTLSQRQRSSRNEVVELGSLIPSCLGPDAWKAAEEFVKNVCKAIQFDCGMCHVEMIYGSRGFRLLDFNPRIPGAGIPRLIERTYAIDLAQLLLRAHLNLPLQSTNPVPQRSFLNRLLGSEIDAEFRAPWKQKSFFENTVQVEIFTEGTLRRCETNLDYFGEILCEDSSPEAVARKMDVLMPILERELKLPLIKWSEHDRDMWEEYSEFEAVLRSTQRTSVFLS